MESRKPLAQPAHRVVGVPDVCPKCSADLLRVGGGYVSCYICCWDAYLAPPLSLSTDGRKNRYGR